MFYRKFLLPILFLFSLSGLVLAGSQPKKEDQKVLPGKIGEKKITVNFHQASLKEVLDALRKTTDLNFFLSPEIKEKEIKVTLSLKKTPLEEALRQIFSPQSLHYDWKFNSIVIYRAQNKKWLEKKIPSNLPQKLTSRIISINFHSLSLRSYSKILRDLTGFNTVVSPKVKKRTIDIHQEKQSLSNFLALLLYPQGLEFKWKNGAILIYNPEKKTSKKKSWSQPLPSRLAKKKISLNFQKTPLADAVDFLRSIAQVNIFFSPHIDLKKRKITLSMAQVSLDQALKMILLAQNLKYTWKYSSIIIYRGDRGKWLGRKIPTSLPQKFFDKKVTINFTETPLVQVLNFLRAITGFPIKVSKALKARPIKVSFQAKKIPLAHVLALLFHPRDLTYQWQKGVLLLGEKNR